MSISKDVIKQCLTGHSDVVQHQGGINLQQGDATIGEVCQGARGLEMPADYL